MNVTYRIDKDILSIDNQGHKTNCSCQILQVIFDLSRGTIKTESRKRAYR